LWIGLLAVGTATIGACSGSLPVAIPQPNANPAGLFTKTFSSAGLTHHATLVHATAADPATRYYLLHVDLPTNQAFVVATNCTTGTVTIEDGPGAATGHCKGRERGGLEFCAGGKFDIVMMVSVRQTRKWGAAIYRTPPCDP
jgi:hypothetical protein